MKRESTIIAILSSFGIFTIIMLCFIAIASQQYEVAALQQQMLQYDGVAHQKPAPPKAKVKLTKKEKAIKRALLTSGEL